MYLGHNLAWPYEDIKTNSYMYQLYHEIRAIKCKLLINKILNEDMVFKPLVRLLFNTMWLSPSGIKVDSLTKGIKSLNQKFDKQCGR